MTVLEGRQEKETEREASAWVLSCLSESICQTVFTLWKLPCCFPLFKHCAYWFFYRLVLQIPSISTFQCSVIHCEVFPLYEFPPFKFSQTILNHCSLDLLLWSPPPFPLSTPLFWVHPSSCCGVARAFQGHVWGRRIFPMGPQVKTRTRSVRRGTPSVPVAALARGDPCHPSSFQSINPTPQFMRSPSLLCFGEPCWITRNVSHSPSQRNPSTFLLAHSPCISSLIYPWLPFHFPPTSSPTLPLFCFTSTHITCFSLHL